jgi:hypothetical protein
MKESWVPEPLPPPLSLAETDDGPLWAPFFFWFQRGLALATALRRLAKYPKSVSEPALSITDRPWPSEGRIKKYIIFNVLLFLRERPFRSLKRYRNTMQTAGRVFGRSFWAECRHSLRFVPRSALRTKQTFVFPASLTQQFLVCAAQDFGGAAIFTKPAIQTDRKRWMQTDLSLRLA